VKPLVEMLKSGSPELRVEATRLISNLAVGNLKNQSTIAEAGAIQVLVDI